MIEPNLMTTDNRTAAVPDKHQIHEWSLNIRCILGEYMIGTGSRDISKLISMMSIKGGHSFDR